MPRLKPSTQAMVEFQRMLGATAYWLKLQRTGKFWELWFAGDDFGVSEAEKAKLDEESNEGSYVYYSHSYGNIRIDPKGAIRSFDFGGRYTGRSVLHQLISFFDAFDFSYGGIAIIDIRFDMRPNGQNIDVDVIAIEDDGWIEDDNQFVAKQFVRVVGEFTFDPANNLLLHRAK
jgi:hypothetical protein